MREVGGGEKRNCRTNRFSGTLFEKLHSQKFKKKKRKEITKTVFLVVNYFKRTLLPAIDEQ